MILVKNIVKKFDVESIVYAYDSNPHVLERVFFVSSIEDLKDFKDYIIESKSLSTNVVNILTSIDYHIEYKTIRDVAECSKEKLESIRNDMLKHMSKVEAKYSNKTLLEVIKEIGVDEVVKLDKTTISEIIGRTSFKELEEFVQTYDIVYVRDIIKILVSV